MATQTQALVAGTPVDLSDGLTINNSNHKFQNSGGAPVFIAQVLDTAADPVAGDPASVLAPGCVRKRSRPRPPSRTGPGPNTWTAR